MSAASDTEIGKSKPRSTWASRLRFQFSMRTLLVLVILSAVGCWTLLTLLSTPGGRHYFSPDTLDTKAQSERLLLLTEIPVYRSGFSFYRWELVSYLIDRGYWTPRNVASPRWIGTSRWNAQWRDGQSRVHKEFSWRGSSWIEWSEQNPELAAVAWPLILNVLRSDVSDCQDVAITIGIAARKVKSKDEFLNSVRFALREYLPDAELDALLLAL